jgi:predicted metal-dependent hydrolase
MSQQYQDRDENFYKRADALINLANEHINNEETRPALANDSLLYASARFSTWIAAASFKSGEEFTEDKENIIEFFTQQYKEMIEEHFKDYAENYDTYMGVSKEK